MQDRLRNLLDDIAAGGRAQEPRNADAFATLNQHLGKRQANNKSPLELAIVRQSRCKAHRRRAVRPNPHGMRSFPFPLAHIEMIVACGTPPIDILRRFPRYEAAVLPEVLTRARPASAVQTVNDRRRDPARLKNEPRHRVGKLTGADNRRADRTGLAAVPSWLGHRDYPMRALSRRITLGIVSPSARAAKVNAIRCLSTGSARSSTSSTDGAKRPSRRARARTANIRAWLARGPGPQEMSLPISPPSGLGRADRTSARIASTTDSPTGRRRTRRCAESKSSEVIAALARDSSAPVVSNKILRSAS